MSEMTEVLRKYIEDTVEKLVDKPEEVKVDISTSTKSIIVQINTSQSDLGKVIGKRGRTVDALKTLALAIKNTKYASDTRRLSLEILEDEGSQFNYKKQGGERDEVKQRIKS